MLCNAIRRSVGTHDKDRSTKISHVMDKRACVCVCVCVCARVGRYYDITMNGR